jgi:tetratricopeptide (TPR) repeat protein
VLALGVDRYPDLGSLMINRAEMAIAAGHYDEAIKSLTKLETEQPDSLSPYGTMWIWANTSCALHASGKAEEAKAMDAKLAAKPDDNWSAVTAAAACRGDVKAVGDLLIKRLREDDARMTALGLFIQFGTPEARTPFEQQVRDVMARARALPEVQAEFAKYGRTIRYAGTTQGWSDF